jgi:hypothetical protein
VPPHTRSVLPPSSPNEPYGKDLENKLNIAEPLNKVFMASFKDRMGLSGQSLAAFCDNLGEYSLAGLENEIKCPLLYISCEGEGPLAAAAGHKFFEKLACPKTERVVHFVDGGEAHCALNDPSLKHQIEFDWLDDVFK